MMYSKQEAEQEEQDIGLLKAWLPRISGENRAFIKGATKALLYAQEKPGETTADAQKKGIKKNCPQEGSVPILAIAPIEPKVRRTIGSSNLWFEGFVNI